MAKKPTTALAAPDIDVPATDDDQLHLAADGNAIAAFFRGLATWLTNQRAWEKKAEARLMAAKAIAAPTDAASDEVVQKFITSTTALEKEFDDHSTVKPLIWRLHKRAVAIHNRAASPLAEAKGAATTLHNTYVETERRRVAAENERRQRDAEDQARRDREAELQRLEAEALKAEAGTDALSERESAFIEAYYAGRARGNATEAARMAGFKDAFASGARLLASAKIRAVLDGKRQAEVIREQQAAVKDAPLDVAPIAEVRADVGRAGSDVSRWRAELFDAELLMQAVFDNKLGIPRDVLKVDEVKLNAYARDLREIVNRWPGCRAKKSTSVR